MLFGFLKAVALIGLPFFLLRLGLDFVARGPIAQAVGAAVSYLAILVFSRSQQSALDGTG